MVSRSLLELHQATIVRRNRLFVPQGSQQFSSIGGIDDWKFVNRDGGKAAHGRVEIVIGSDCDHVAVHQISGVGEFPQRFVIQVRADIVGGKNSDEFLFPVDHWEIVLPGFGQHVHDLIESRRFGDQRVVGSLVVDIADLDAFEDIDEEIAPVSRRFQTAGHLLGVELPGTSHQKRQRRNPHCGQQQPIAPRHFGNHNDGGKRCMGAASEEPRHTHNSERFRSRDNRGPQLLKEQPDRGSNAASNDHRRTEHTAGAAGRNRQRRREDFDEGDNEQYADADAGRMGECRLQDAISRG